MSDARPLDYWNEADEQIEWPTDQLPDGWDWSIWSSAFQDETHSAHKLQTTHYQGTGALPIIDQGEKKIAGWTDRSELAYKGTLPVVIFGDHTRKIQVADGPFVQGADGVKVLVPTESCGAHYLAAMLRAGKIPEKGYSRHFKFIKASRFPMAPLPEQRRIVAKLNALQSRTRLAREALAAIPALLDHYRQSVLAAAFRGELTTEWRASRVARTPVDKALRSIETPPRPSRYGSRSDTVIAGDYALAVGNPESELPAGWTWTPLVDIARLESGHTPSRQHPEWWGGDVPWICIPDARDHHGRSIMRTTENTNNLGLENSAARLLPAGTVCLSRTASVGYVTVMGKPMATSQDFVNWVCTPIIDPHWLKFLLIAENQALFRFGKGSTHTTIYFPEVISFHVGLPPIEEQRRIVEILELQMRRISELAVIVDAGLAKCARLDQSTLATAFRGELVPQDPADEPASVLLDRIRAARTQAGDAPRARRPHAPAAPAPARAAEPAATYAAGSGRSDPYATLLAALRAKGSLASGDAQAATGLDAAAVRPLLQRLVAKREAKVEGQKRGTRYVATH